MLAKFAKALATLACFAATLAILSGVSLFLLGSYLATWPIMRKSPRDRRLRATMDAAVAVMGLLQVYGERLQANKPADSDVY